MYPPLNQTLSQEVVNTQVSQLFFFVHLLQLQEIFTLQTISFFEKKNIYIYKTFLFRFVLKLCRKGWEKNFKAWAGEAVVVFAKHIRGPGLITLWDRKCDGGET